MAEVNWRPFESYAEKLMVRHKIPGASVAVAVDGKRAYTHGFGFRDVERGLPVTDQTIFGIGSITKSFTAVAIMQLQEQGKLAVADPVLKYLPELRAGKSGAEKAMTIHHFLTHTSGMPPLPSLLRAIARSLWEDTEGMEKAAVDQIKAIPPIDTSEQLMEFIASLDFAPLGAPGLQFSYSNDCYALLGAIIERVSGERYQDYVMNHITRPLGMERTTFDLDFILRSDDAAKLHNQRHIKGRDIVEASPKWWECTSMAAAGFLRSTAADMLKYMEIYRTGGTRGTERILSEASIVQMTTPYARTVSGLHYGYGLMVHPNYHSVSLVEHGGNIKGISAYVSCVPEKGITGVVLTNLSTAPGGELLLGAINATLGLPSTTPRFQYRDYDCPPALMERYAGDYRSEEGAAIRIAVKGNRLAVTSADGTKLTARPIGRDLFAARRKGVDTAARFLVDDKGAVYAVEFGFRIIRRVQAKPGQ